MRKFYVVYRSGLFNRNLCYETIEAADVDYGYAGEHGVSFVSFQDTKGNPVFVIPKNKFEFITTKDPKEK